MLLPPFIWRSFERNSLCIPKCVFKGRVRKVREVHRSCFSLHLKLDSSIYPIPISFAFILEWTLSSTSILGQVHLPSVSSPSILYPRQLATLLINPPEFQTMVVTSNSLFCCAPSLSARKLSSLFNTCFHFKSYSAVKSSLMLSENPRVLRVWLLDFGIGQIALRHALYIFLLCSLHALMVSYVQLCTPDTCFKWLTGRITNAQISFTLPSSSTRFFHGHQNGPRNLPSKDSWVFPQPSWMRNSRRGDVTSVVSMNS